ncbi:prevent-host-death family protein [Hoeflea marina]|uniref:Antitoxin n=1 Tax=Hoeflea marina TaxID=274592 RepID=A0A317PH20_9HYPH|nr:type II toxin-antitoxin system prevent-host-death family antitoxin [Hoeflea marina]PWV98181.1 prevent-host-death family protein [Hoeflea marina]
MKVMQATDAKNQFGKLLEDSLVEPILIRKNGRDVAVLLSKAEYDRSHAQASKRDLVMRYHEESIEAYSAVYEALAK